MEPRPPELIHRRGSLKRMNCAAHIWCWPTSLVTMASPPERRSISAIRCCGLISSSEVDGVERMLVLPVADLLPPGRARGGVLRLHRRLPVSASSLLSFSSTRFTSPTIGTSGVRFLPIFGGIDIDVDHFGVRREGGEAAGDAIVEAHAEGDQQIGSWSSPCWRRSCRACRAC